METQIHPNLKKISDSLKDSINELLREIDIGRPSGILVPEFALVDLTTALKLYKMIEKLSDIDDVVGQPGLPCPVQSQDAIAACRNIADDQTKADSNNLDFLK